MWSVTSSSGLIGISIISFPNALRFLIYEESDNRHIVFLTSNICFAIWHATMFTSSSFVTDIKIVSESIPAFFRTSGCDA